MTAGTKTYYPSSWRQMLALAGALFLAIVCWGLAFDPQAGPVLNGWGRVGIVFFGLCAGLALAQLVPGASFLRLDDSGFTIRSFWRDRFYPWAEIEGFGVAKGSGRHDWVGFNFVPGSTLAAQVKGRELNRSLMGYDSMLPDSYGWATAVLADYLNQWRRTSLGIAVPDAAIAPAASSARPATLAWSATRLKFTLGIGSLGLAALMGEIYGKSLPFWIILPVILLPLCIFVFIQPNEGLAVAQVRRFQAFGACWYLAAASFCLCRFFAASPRPAALLIYSLCLAVGAIPCVMVLWRLWQERQNSPAQNGTP